MQTLRDQCSGLTLELQSVKAQLAMANHEHQRNRDILSSENRSREEIIRILVQDLVNTATEAKTFYQNLSRVEQRIVPLREFVAHLSQLIQCPVCLDSMTHPVMFVCGHVFCDACTSTTRNCPICRHAIGDHRVRVYLLGNVVESLQTLTRLNQQLA